MLGQVFCAIYAAVLSARASEAEHQVFESAFDVACEMGVGQEINMFQEGDYLTVVFEKAYYGFVKTGQRLVFFVSSGIVRCPAVEYVAASVAAHILGDAFFIGKTVNTYHADMGKDTRGVSV